MNDYTEQLILGIEGAAYFRHNKSVEYPDDERNIISAEALDKLAEYVKEIDDNHPVLQAFALWSEADPDNSISCIEHVSNELSRFCFNGEEENEPFLQRLASKIREELGIPAVRSAS